MTIWDFFDKHDFLATILVIYIGWSFVELAQAIGKIGRR